MHNHDIAEQNIERLLSSAYQPEDVPPDFAQRLEATMCRQAQDLAAARAAVVPDHIKYRTLRRRLGWVMAAAACVALCALVMYAQRGPRKRLTDDVFEDDRAGLVQPASPALGMTPRPRPATAPAKPLAVGERIATRAGERRRVTLADGSILYLNENSALAYHAARKVELTSGEVYVEVAPRPASDIFEIKTPARTVAALGTHFAVQAKPAGTGVLVTQGKVQLGDAVVTAGQQVEPGSTAIAPAPRASHVLAWTRDLMSAAETPLVPCSKHAGGSLVAVDPNGQEMHLSMRNYHIDVHIEDGFARTTIDQTYFNHSYGRLEGTFYFPLPADASLSRLAMYVEENGMCRLMEGGMAERDHARNVYETIRHTQRDPALLEWVDGTTFKMRVFPLEGRKEKRIILSYTQRLSSLYGFSRYRFPGGHTMEAVRDWSFRAFIKDGAKLNISTDPNLQISRDGPDAVLTMQAKNIKPDRDVTLEIMSTVGQVANLPFEAKERTRFSTMSHEGADYLMVRHRPALKSEPKKERRHWVVLFESSSSRNPLLARAQIDLIRYLLLNAEHDDTFAVVTAGTRATIFDEKPRPATPDNIAAAVKFLEGTHLIGALDLDDALKAVTPLLETRNSKLETRNPHLVHIGGGLATIGETRYDVLAGRLPEGTRYVGIGVGKRWNRNFMKLAAERTAGYYRQVTPDEPLPWHAFDLISTLNTPRLMQIKVVDNAERATFLTEANMISQGEDICAITRIERGKPQPESITISGKLDGKPFTRVLKVGNVAGKAGYLPRAWAKLELDRLIAEGTDKHKPRIIELSKASYVMSPFTSLLVLETDADYERFKVDRGRKDHWAMYSCPDRIPIVYEPSAVAVNTPKPSKADGKRTAKDVLSSIVVRVSPSALTAWQLYLGAYAQGIDDYGLMGLGRGPLNELSERVRVLALNPAIAETNIAEKLARFDARWMTGAHWSATDSLVNGLADFQTMTTNSQIVKALSSGGVFNVTLGALNSGPFAADYKLLRNPLPDVLLMDGAERTFGGWVYKVNVNGPLDRIQFAPTFVSPTMQWAVPNGAKGVDANTIDFFPPALGLNVRSPFPRIHTKFTGDLIGGRYRRPIAGDFREKALLRDLDFANPYATLDLGAGTMASDLRPLFRILPDSEQARIMREQYYQARINTAKKRFDYELYVKANTPSFTEEQVKIAQHLLRRIQTAHPSDIFSGKALNLLLDEFRKHQGGSIAADMPISEEVLKRLNITKGAGSLGLLRDGGRLTWPAALQQVLTAAEREQVERRLQALVQKAKSVDVPDNLVKDLEKTMAGAGADLARMVNDVPTTQYLEAKRFLNSFNDALLALGHGEAIPYAAYQKWIAGGKTVQDLADYMSKHGLKFAAAAPGDEASYQAIHSALAVFAAAHEITVSELTSYAPGLQTSLADIQAVLEAEASDLQFASGTIDERARALIDRARAAGWRSVTIAGHRKQNDATIVYDGAGRYSWNRLLSNGLREIVACDGDTLRHSYPEIGLGSKRKLSRFHRAELAELVPWLVPPADDLARGADVKVLDKTTVAIVPHQSSSKTDALLPAIHGHLIFAVDGRLAERRLVAMPEQKVLYREVYEGNGTITWFAGSEKKVGDFQLEVRSAWAPSLTSENAKLTWVRMPNRVGDGQDVTKLANLDRGSKDGFAQRLITFRYLWQHWNGGQAGKGTAAQVQLERRRLLEFVKDCPAVFAWPLLEAGQRVGTSDAEFQGGLAEVYGRLSSESGLAYRARYEQARCLVSAGQLDKARDHFEKLYLDAAADGALPPIDAAFRNALQGDNRYARLMRQTAAGLVKKQRPTAVLALAWQNLHLGDQPLADELVTRALCCAPEKAKPFIKLAGVQFLVKTSQFVRADVLLQEVLNEKSIAADPGVWRLAMDLAQRRGSIGRAAVCLGNALDIEYRDLPEVVDLQKVRADYGQLLNLYHQQALALTGSDADTLKGFQVKVVRAADRWRALDGEATQACQLAAKILQVLGNRELAWAYLTTPIDQRPNESAPWLELAGHTRDNDFELTDRAYALAFRAEATNAQILWDHAQYLRASGRHEQAQRIFRQLADGDWQPRFQNLKSQARGQLLPE